MNENTYFKLGEIYYDLGNIEKVKETMLASLYVAKTVTAYRILGNIAISQKKPLEAISYYEAMASFDQTKNERIENGYNCALAYAQAGKTEIAQSRLLSILQVQPDYVPALRLQAELKKQK
jgi:tetratricopeptide (TPR) repeat protein